jgi:O-antigen/teichoic acid export membrane protein
MSSFGGPSSVFEKTIHGGMWEGSIRTSTHAVSLLRTLVLARLLAPYDFGLMGIALLATSILETFSETGFEHALIQKKGDIEEYLDTAWMVQVSRGLVLGLVLYATAPWIATFFASPEAVEIVHLVCLAVMVAGFRSIGLTLLTKEMRFKRRGLVSMSSAVANFVVSVTAAVALRNASAIAYGLLAGNTVATIVSYGVHPYRPSLRWNTKRARELLGFGRWIHGSTILVFLFREGDDIFLGKVLGTLSLGLYQMAYRVSNLPATQVTHLISKVMLPAYAEIQDRREQLRSAYLQALSITTAVATPLAFAVAYFAPDFTKIILGDKWLPMVPIVQILALFGLIRSIDSCVGPLVVASGRPDLETKLLFGKVLLLAVIIYPLTMSWGAPGTATAVTLASLAFSPVFTLIAIRVLRCRPKELVSRQFGPLLAGVGMLIPVHLIDQMTWPGQSAAKLVVLGSLSLAVYVILMNKIDPWLGLNIGQTLKRMFKAI